MAARSAGNALEEHAADHPIGKTKHTNTVADKNVPPNKQSSLRGEDLLPIRKHVLRQARAMRSLMEELTVPLELIEEVNECMDDIDACLSGNFASS